MYLIDMILTFYIDYRMYSASAFAANAVVRSAIAAAFPLFTVQLFTNVSRSNSLFSFFRSNIDYVVSLKAGNKLGMHFDWLHRSPMFTLSVLILQIWCQNTGPQQICAMYRKYSFFEN